MSGRDPNLWEPLIADGRPLLGLTGFILVFSGLFAILQSASGQFLPHDAEYLGMSAADLCRRNGCRIVHFMIHDRVAFGGSLVAIGTLYLWLAAFPLKAGEAWAWRLFAVSGAAGFGSFLVYLGHGYLDTWHGAATLALLPVFILGMVRSRRLVAGDMRPYTAIVPLSVGRRADLGRCLLLVAALGIAGAGLVIMTVGATAVFVPQDLDYLGVSAAELNAINPRLIPLIAHDRAGFGGGLCCLGITLAGCLLYAAPVRSLLQALGVAGAAAFGTAILVHPAIGYTSFVHLLPAYAGAAVYAAGLVLLVRGSRGVRFSKK